MKFSLNLFSSSLRRKYFFACKIVLAANNQYPEKIRRLFRPQVATQQQPAIIQQQYPSSNQQSFNQQLAIQQRYPSNQPSSSSNHQSSSNQQQQPAIIQQPALTHPSAFIRQASARLMPAFVGYHYGC